MKNIKLTYRLLIISVLLISFSCREEIALETETFESVLVVEATITNELKQHEVKVSRTYLLEEIEPVIENNADVSVTDNTGNSFNFSQNSEGVYVSDSAFEALPNVEYTLIINTVDGKTYTSNTQILSPISQINNLYAEHVNDDVKGDGIQVFVDSDNSNTEAKYFRYQYEETYQVVAPLYFEEESLLTNFEFLNGSPNVGAVSYDTEFVLRNEEQQTCYASATNTEIIQTTTNELDNNIVLRFPIRFIRSDDGLLRDRYSILVEQYSQSIESYSFYSIISELGNIESVLSQNQPGYVEGNVTASNNERVVGFFEVASVSKERLFFNYFDFNIAQPDYLYECEFIELDYTDNAICGQCLPPNSKNQRHEIYRLLTEFENENLDYHIIERPTPTINALWRISNPECTDCTTVGSNIKPDFWVD
jgi:hypothetical protein